MRSYSNEFALSTATTALALGLGANECLLVNSCTVVNRDSVDRLLTMHRASDGGALSDANLIEYQTSLPINRSTNTALSGKTITPGSELYVYVDGGTACTLSIDGTIITQAP